jgi:hypothetical protein
MTANQLTVRRDPFRGWEACHLENDYVHLVTVPDIGGRVMACDLGPYPFLWTDPDLSGKLFSAEENQGDGSLGAWKNYGGEKTWPAPQGWDNDQQWPGPPDPVLDSGRYTLDKLAVEGDQAVVVMTSPPDARTGVQITRRFALTAHSSRVRVDLTFTNVSARTIRWSVWDVAQLRAERRLPDGTLAYEPTCTITTPLNPHSRFPRGFTILYGADDNPQWQSDPASGLFRAQFQWQIGKVGLDSQGGWIAFNNAAAGYAFTERFTHEPAGDYPDDGATVEVWTVGTGEVGNLNYEGTEIYFMEAEVLSPLRTLSPGAQTTFTLDWGVCRCAGAVIGVTAGGCLSAPLALERLDGGYSRVTAAGGVFDAGTLELAWLDAQRATISTQPLGPVDPLTVVRLDRIVPVPDRAAWAVLRVGGAILAESQVGS